jgi:hypothetical protein
MGVSRWVVGVEEVGDKGDGREIRGTPLPVQGERIVVVAAVETERQTLVAYS